MELADLEKHKPVTETMLHVTTLKTAILKQQHLEFRVNETLKLHLGSSNPIKGI